MVAPMSHRLDLPVEHQRQCPHTGRNEQITWSPGLSRSRSSSVISKSLPTPRRIAALVFMDPPVRSCSLTPAHPLAADPEALPPGGGLPHARSRDPSCYRTVVLGNRHVEVVAAAAAGSRVGA